MKTIEAIKNDLAFEYGYNAWVDLRNAIVVKSQNRLEAMAQIEALMERVAVIHAKSAVQRLGKLIQDDLKTDGN